MRHRLSTPAGVSSGTRGTTSSSGGCRESVDGSSKGTVAVGAMAGLVVDDALIQRVGAGTRAMPQSLIPRGQRVPPSGQLPAGALGALAAGVGRSRDRTLRGAPSTW